MKNIKKVLYYFVFCLAGILIFGDNVYATTPYILSSYNSNFPFGYGVYCPYGAVSSDGTLVSDTNGRPKVFYSIIYFGNGLDTYFEFGDTRLEIENDLGIFIENGNPNKTLSDASQIDWLKEKGLISSDGKWSCPDLDDPEDKNGDGYTKYQSFVTTDGTGSICNAGNNSCLVTDMPELDKINYTCTYIGQSTGKTLTINVFENDEGHIIREVTYPDGVIQAETAGIMVDEDCSQDIYYISDNRKIEFSSDSNEVTSNNPTLYSLCRDYDQSQIEHFCSGTCTYPEMTCPVDENGEYCGIFEEEDMEFINKIFNYVKIGVPILLILFGIVDFGQAVLSDDRDSVKKATNKFIKRCIIAVAIFFVPTIIQLLLNIYNDVAGSKISTCGIK